ncbi:MAG: hypothetical protein ACLGXA_07660 [Acidobacteriota bacterium]
MRKRSGCGTTVLKDVINPGRICRNIRTEESGSNRPEQPATIDEFIQRKTCVAGLQHAQAAVFASQITTMGAASLGV